MPHLELSNVDYFLDDGRQLLRNIGMRLGDGERRALVGPNGVGKTTLLRLLAGDLQPHEGVRSSSGSIGVMSQLVGQKTAGQTIEDVLLAVSASSISGQARAVREQERRMNEIGDERSQLAYAEAIIGWGDVGGYDEENRWDEIVLRTLGVGFEDVRGRPAAELSGGEQKRLVLEALASGPQDILILDEPDNFLDIEGKRWLEALIREVPKSVLFVTHDREVIANSASSIATLERSSAGATLWVHGAGYRDYAAQRVSRASRAEELRRRWNEDEQQLKRLVLMYREKSKYNSDMAKRYQAAQSRLERFRADGPPEAPPLEEQFNMRLRGGRTAKRALTLSAIAVPGLFGPFSSEIWFGDRVAIVGPNGSGKSHLLRLIAGGAAQDEPRHEVEARRKQIGTVDFGGGLELGSRVRPGYFVQTLERADLTGRTLLQILHAGDGARPGLDRANASAALNRYGLVGSAESRWEELSGGQRARLQILLLELGGANLLLLDEPTDNLDVESADELETALQSFEGTVIAITHDRWFARSFERFIAIARDGHVEEVHAPTW